MKFRELLQFLTSKRILSPIIHISIIVALKKDNSRNNIDFQVLL